MFQFLFFFEKQIYHSLARGLRSRSLETRVNSTNVLDEGHRIGGRGRWMNSKVKVSQTRRDYVCIKNKHSNQLAQSQSVSGPYI
jgi:hypothetical protein